MTASTVIYANTLAGDTSKRLDGDKLRRIVDAKSLADAFKMLGDYGYGYDPDGSIDGFIIAESNKLIEFIEDTAPSARVAEALLAPYVYNNVKLAYKARFVEIPLDAYYKTELDAGRITLGDYNDCDKYLADALYALDTDAEKRPKSIDLAITRAMYKSVLSCPVKAIKNYYRAEIDMKNILTAARMFRLKVNAATADEFIEGGTIDFDTLIEAASGKNFALCFMGTKYEDMAERLEKSGFESLGAFEREADDYLFFMTDALCKKITSYEPYLNYYTEQRIELKTLKTALVCIKTDTRNLMYDRIPEIYR